MPKPLTVWITVNWKILKRWESQTTWPASWEICMQVRNQQLELDMEQQTGSKWGKDFIKTVYCHPAYLTYLQSISCEILGWMKHKLESRLLQEISVTSDKQMTLPFYGRKWGGVKEPFDESEWGKWKSWLKTQHSKNEDHSIQSHHFMENRWGNNGNSDRLYFLRLQKSLQIVAAAMKSKDACSLEEKQWQS